jgi:hypothetical protein
MDSFSRWKVDNQELLKKRKTKKPMVKPPSQTLNIDNFREQAMKQLPPPFPKKPELEKGNWFLSPLFFPRLYVLFYCLS